MAAIKINTKFTREDRVSRLSSLVSISRRASVLLMALVFMSIIGLQLYQPTTASAAITGVGDAQDPYIINSCQDLQNIGSSTGDDLEALYQLGGPIDCSASVTWNGGKGYWNGHFSITPDVLDPTVTNLSFGFYQGQATQFSAKTGSPDPATIDKASGVTKYEMIGFVGPSPSPTGSAPVRDQTVRGTVLLQVLDNNQMKMEAFPGKPAAQVTGFTSAAKTYER